MRADDLTRELGKALEALQWTEKHLTATNEGNAALHCNPKVFHSPLTTQVHEAALSLERVIADVDDSAPDRVELVHPAPKQQASATKQVDETQLLRAVVYRAYALADRWQAAHGSSSFLVKAAGAELRDELDGDEADRCDRPDHQSHPGFSCAEVDQTKPYWNVRWGQENIARTYGDRGLAAAECAAHSQTSYLSGPRPGTKCIRAAQHRGDHIDEHGFHWSDTVALYPVDTGPEKTGMPLNFDVPVLHGTIQFRAAEPEPQHRKAYASSCSNPDHACDTCGECVRQHPGEGGCFDSDQTPPNQGPLTGVEVRDPCPHCEDCALIPRRQMILHLRDQHPGAVCDFPLGWRVAKAYTLDEHNPKCSYARTRGALLCDCHILYPEPQPADTLASHDNGPKAATEATKDPADGTARTPRQRAYKAVSDYLLTLGWHSLATRSQIWRAVNRALEAAGHTSDPRNALPAPARDGGMTLICHPCRDAAAGVPGAEHCDEPANPGRASWACACQHRPPVRRTNAPKEA